jgi:hypothetical protein
LYSDIGGTYIFWHLGKPQLQEMWAGARILLPRALSISNSGWAQNRELQLSIWLKVADIRRTSIRIVLALEDSQGSL